MQLLSFTCKHWEENYGAEHSVIAPNQKKYLQFIFPSSQFLSCKYTAYSPFSRVYGSLFVEKASKVGSVYSHTKGFHTRRDSVGFAWVFLLSKDTGQDFQGFAHCAHSHLYHQKAPDSERVFYTPVVPMTAQRAVQQGPETGTRWQRGTGLQQPRFPSEPPGPLAATVVLVPT